MILPNAITALLAMRLVLCAFGMNDVSMGKADFSMTPGTSQPQSDLPMQASEVAMARGFLAQASEAVMALHHYSADRPAAAVKDRGAEELEDAKGAAGMEGPAANEVKAAKDKGMLPLPLFLSLAAEPHMPEDSTTSDAKQEEAASTQPHKSAGGISQLGDRTGLTQLPATAEPDTSTHTVAMSEQGPSVLNQIAAESTQASMQEQVSNMTRKVLWNKFSYLVKSVKNAEWFKGIVTVEKQGSFVMELLNEGGERLTTLEWPEGTQKPNVSNTEEVLGKELLDIVRAAVQRQIAKKGGAWETEVVGPLE